MELECPNKYPYSVIDQTFCYIKNEKKGELLIGALEFGGMEIFTVKWLSHSKLTFMVTSENGSTLHRDEAATSCVCKRNSVV